MARKAAAKPELSLFKRELAAVIFFGCGFFLFLSLLSYSPQDPSFLSVSSNPTLQNWGGIVGAYLADTLLFLIGAASFGLVFFCLLVGVHLFAGLKRRLAFYELPVGFLLLILLAILSQLVLGHLNYGATQLEAGGLLGGILAREAMSFLGKPGAYLLAVTGVVLSFIWVTRLSLQRLFAVVLAWNHKGFQSFISAFRVYGARLIKGAQSWNKTRIEKKNQEFKAAKSTELTIHNPFAKPKSGKKEAGMASPITQEPIDELPVFTSIEPRLAPRILTKAEPKKSSAETKQLSFNSMTTGYQLPSLTFLDAEHDKVAPVDEESLKGNARLLEKKLLDFNVEGAVTEIHPGPVITMYEFQPAAGVKLSRIANLADDLGLAMGGRSVRIVAPLPNKPAVGIEIPNRDRETVYLKDIIADERFQKSDSKIPIALGKDIEGTPYVGDLAKMPHLLVAGATGAGKSVSINATILSFLYKSSPEDVRLIMVDPKMLELSIYEGIPHLLLPVVTEPKKANLALRWAVREMERRYKMMADVNARNIANYNQKIEKGTLVSRQQEKIKEMGAQVYADEDLIKHEGKIPYIVIIIDELADLMMVAGREVEESITRLAQMARAAGIHLILATQRPSVDVITGIIKANFPARMAFKVSSKHDSRTVLDTIGAERLLGAGDMLFIPPGASRMVRVHAAFISETEVGRVVEFLKKQGKPVYDENILKPVESDESGVGLESDDEADALYDQAVSIVAETKQASISMIQRRLRVGYNRAARMIERMESQGIVSPPSGTGHRQVLVSDFEANP